MDNIKKLKMNSRTSLLNQIVAMLSGLILPRFILTYFGSDVNGLISTITQFLSFIGLLEIGLGSVVPAALYKPLAQNDQQQINKILATARNYFTNIARVLIVYIVILIFVFPHLVNSPYDFLGTSFLIFAMSISTFAKYYFGIVNQLFLDANQKNYISISLQIATVLLSTIASIFLIIQGFSIQTIRLGVSLIYLIRPIFLYYYVKKNYNIDFDVTPDSKSIPQMWNGIAQHIASVILNSTDMVVLGIFSTLENVSIYSVYNMIINGVKLMLTSLTGGLKSFFGNLLAQNQIEQLDNYFSIIEWLIHTTVVYLFGMTAVLINSFVMIYTQGVEDANYYVPLFSLLITLAQAIYCIRLPYNSMVLAAGHFKETQRSSIIEALINLIFSIISVNQLGLVGIALGTLFAMLYRTIYLVIYLSKNILFRPIKGFIKHIIVDTIGVSMMLFIGNIIDVQPSDFISWIILASIFGILFFILTVVLNYLFYKEYTVVYLNKIKNIFKF